MVITFEECLWGSLFLTKLQNSMYGLFTRIFRRLHFSKFSFIKKKKKIMQICPQIVFLIYFQLLWKITIEHFIEVVLQALLELKLKTSSLLFKKNLQQNFFKKYSKILRCTESDKEMDYSLSCISNWVWNKTQ